MSDAHHQYVWDFPIRIFHWSLVALLAFSWWSAENHQMDWHRLSGQAVLFLLLFRLLWGAIGSDTARFRHFIKGPRAIWTYVRSRGEYGPASDVGHNPLGGWSVVAMLLALGAQVVTGLFAVDVDGIESGPLSYLVDFDQGRLASAVHDISFNILIALILLHIVAIIFHLIVRRQNLVGAMVTGRRKPPGAHTPVTVRRAGVVQLLCALMLSGAISWWVFAEPYF